jgi:hypothetical protein
MPNPNKKYAPATQRNREPILAVLQRVLPPNGTVLEISSGTGEHATFFAPRLPNLRWIPSDRSLEAIESIAAWRAELPCDRLYPSVHIDLKLPMFTPPICKQIDWLKQGILAQSINELAKVFSMHPY